MMGKIKIIMNPISGSGRGPRLLKKILKHLDHDKFQTDITTTRQAGDATQEARDLTDASVLVCIGGDGTVNEVINGLLARKSSDPAIPLAVLPMGSGNVIAKELSITRCVRRFVHLLENHKEVLLDIGQVSFPDDTGWPVQQRNFISMAGIGFDAEVAHRYQQTRHGARLQAHLFNYFPLALKTLVKYQPPHISLEVDGQFITDQACFIQVANARSYGGPFVFVPSARPDDGLLDILWFSGQSRGDIFRYFLNAFFGNGSRSKDAHHLQGKKVILKSEEQVPLQVDGDCCGYLPAEVTITPQVLSVLVPLKE
ncbi:MAG: diacylglycerol kinase family lipid kinase [Planctomycetes bacterium]|nr:diacylglycerol kinase family lipid kinase [Planctomycetota bacterium]